MTDAEAIFCARERGEFGPQSVGVSPEWAAVLALQRQFAGFSEAAVDPEALLQMLDNGSDPGVVALAGAILSRRAFVLRCGRTFEALDVLEAALPPDHFGTSLMAAYRSTSLALAPRVGPVIERARESRAIGASAVIEATALAAVGLAESGELDEATRTARRASRMAATEGFPQAIYLANFALARVRRQTGRAHHAARITAGLRRAAPPLWGDLLAWEGALAGDAEATVATGFGAAFDAAIAGDRSAWADACSALVEATRLPLWQRDLASARAAVDPLQPVPAELLRFTSGRDDEPPARVHGLVVHTHETVDAIEAVGVYVAVRPGEARRIVALGTRLAEGPTLARGSERGEALVAALALSEGMRSDGPRLFERLYGFAYQPEVHANVVRVLLHRVRRSLAGLAVIRRDGVALVLEVARPFVVADPRCGQGIPDLILRLVAGNKGIHARAIAERVGVPLRTVQRHLREMVEEGELERDAVPGGRTGYVVEDTTFAQPTRHRAVRTS